MELDDLKAAWQSLNSQVQQQAEVQSRLLTELRVDKAKSRLRPLWIGQGLTLMIGFALTIFFARYWLARTGNPIALISGLLLHAWSVGLIISAVVQLLILGRINYAKPVLILQRSVAHLWLWRTRMTPLLGVAFWILWLPAALVVTDVFTGGALAGALSLRWILGNLVVGALGVIATLAFYRWAQRPSRQHLGRSIDAGNAGPAVVSARAFLDELDAFEHS
jgi:hypothetical protein